MKGVAELVFIILLYAICIFIAIDNQETQTNDTLNSSSQIDINNTDNTNLGFFQVCWIGIKNDIRNILNDIKISVNSNGHVSTGV